MQLDDFNKIRIIKKNRDSVIWEAYYLEKSYILKEILSQNRLMKMIQECKISYLLQQCDSEFNYPIIERIEGTNWFYYLKVPGKMYLSNLLEKDEKLVVANKLIKALEDIHSLPIDGIVNEDVNWKNICLNNVAEAFSKIRSYGLYDNETFCDLYKWFVSEVNRLCLEEKKVLIHNDINKENLIVHVQNGIIQIGIIDFEKFIIGDPLKDISKLIWIFRQDPEFGNLFWEIYCQEKKKNKFETLRLYWGLDILKHLFQWDELIMIPNWDQYLNEEIVILKEIKDLEHLW